MPAHDRVDSLISEIGVTSRRGFAQFLTLHKSCFITMRAATPPASEAALSLSDMLMRIDADLAILDHPLPAPPQTTLGPIDPLAIAYMIEGSRMGSKVLHRRWSATADPLVAQAQSYFSTPADAGRWRTVCDQLAAVPLDSPRADTIIQDTTTLFELFYHSALFYRHASTAPTKAAS